MRAHTLPHPQPHRALYALRYTPHRVDGHHLDDIIFEPRSDGRQQVAVKVAETDEAQPLVWVRADLLNLQRVAL